MHPAVPSLARCRDLVGIGLDSRSNFVRVRHGADAVQDISEGAHVALLVVVELAVACACLDAAVLGGGSLDGRARPGRRQLAGRALDGAGGAEAHGAHLHGRVSLVEVV